MFHERLVKLVLRPGPHEQLLRHDLLGRSERASLCPGLVGLVGLVHLLSSEVLGSLKLLLAEGFSLLLLGALPFWKALLQLFVVVWVAWVE